MKYIATDHLKNFDFLDRYWEIVTWTEEMFAVRVTEPEILGGEHAGKRIEEALVSFRGLRLKHILAHDGVREYSLTRTEALSRFLKRPMFVFNYYPGETECELCGLGADDPLAICFDFETVTVEWDAFEKAPVGSLVRK